VCSLRSLDVLSPTWECSISRSECARVLPVSRRPRLHPGTRHHQHDTEARSGCDDVVNEVAVAVGSGVGSEAGSEYVVVVVLGVHLSRELLPVGVPRAWWGRGQMVLVGP